VGGNVGDDYVWMLDAVDYATTWVSTRAMWNRGQEGTLSTLVDLEQNLAFPLLGLDSDNGGEFLNYHVMARCKSGKRFIDKRARSCAANWIEKPRG
jgi:hypothetical protein